MDFETIFQSQLEKIDLSGYDYILENSGLPDYLSSRIVLRDILYNMISGNQLVSIDEIFLVIKTMALGELKSVMLIAAELIVLSLVTGLLGGITSGFGNDTVSNTSILICNCLAAGISMNAFYQIYIICFDAVTGMTLLMDIGLPVIFSLTVFSGGITSATVMNSVVSASVTAFSGMVQKFFMPSVFLSCIFAIINSFSAHEQVKKISQFLRSVALFGTGMCITVFTGLSVIQSMMTKSADSILLNTARFSADNFIPIVGGFTADSLEMLVACVKTLRGGIGVTGVVVLVLLLLSPLIKAIVITLLFKLTAIILEPLSDKKMSDSMNDMGSASAILTSLLLLTAIMFIIFFATAVKSSPEF